jgi:hypothetical protein
VAGQNKGGRNNGPHQFRFDEFHAFPWVGLPSLRRDVSVFL